MSCSRTQVFLGFVSGLLLIPGLILPTVALFELNHHMFILSGSPLAFVSDGILVSAPLLLAIELARRAFSKELQTSRRLAIALFLASLLALLMPVTTLAIVTLGSLGMDIHLR